MESRHETSSVILKLMGIDKVPSHDSQVHTIGNRQKVLSEDYRQKVASIGLTRKRSSRQYRSFTDEKEKTDHALKVVKTIRRDKNHNPSKGNKEENSSLFGLKVEVMQQKTNNGSQIRLPKSQSDRKDLTFDSRIVFSKDNRGKERNDKIKRNIKCKVGFGYSFDRKVTMTKPLADDCVTMTKDDLFQKYWGLRKNVFGNRPIEKSENRNINQKDCSENMNRNSCVKSAYFSSYFNMNDTENINDLHKLKKRCYGYGNNLSKMEPIISQVSISDSQILQQTCLMNEDVKNNEDSYMSKNIAMSLDSSVDFVVADVENKVVGCTTQKSESTVSVMTHGDGDSLCHASYASKQKERSEFQEDSEGDTDSLGNFHEAHEPSPISVLDSTFSEDISVISEGAGVYDSSEMEDEGHDMNVSSDEECGTESESVCGFEEKKDIIGLSRAEESRDFSYVVEVLTEAGIPNTSLFKDFSTWHSAECPISPSVFETLEKKFGEQHLWKRSERRLLFDHINLGLLHILHPYLYVPTWEKPVSRRMNTELRQDMIADEMWGLLVSQEKKASKESENDMLSGGEIRWIELGEDVEDIVKEIVKLLIDELVEEIVRLENF